jgi:hypothetical protein
MLWIPQNVVRKEVRKPGRSRLVNEEFLAVSRYADAGPHADFLGLMSITPVCKFSELAVDSNRIATNLSTVSDGHADRYSGVASRARILPLSKNV